MELLKKIKTLGEAANYDTVCGSPRFTGMGNKSLIDTVSSFIYKTRSEKYDCRMLKVLQTNKCLHDCKYCLNRCGKQKTLTEFKPEELSKVFIHLCKKGLVNSLFLSSGVCKDPDTTTENMLRTIKLLRIKNNFGGYIHFKILPGTSKDLIKQARKFADRLSINIEACSKTRLSEISSNKDFKTDILKRQNWIKKENPSWGQTTQLIVGSQDESDKEILKTVDYELNEFNLKRFYFSAFSPVKGTPLENHKKAPLNREKRLYNVEFMLREYKFPLNDFELILNKHDMLPSYDPKIALANETITNPIDINEARYEELLKVPGIGIKTAQKILSVRRSSKIKKYEQLHNIGISIKRAKPYIKVDGKTQKRLSEF